MAAYGTFEMNETKDNMSDFLPMFFADCYCCNQIVQPILALKITQVSDTVSTIASFLLPRLVILISETAF